MNTTRIDWFDLGSGLKASPLGSWSLHRCLQPNQKPYKRALGNNASHLDNTIKLEALCLSVFIDMDSSHVGHSRNITELRKSAVAVLSILNFREILWISVFLYFFHFPEINKLIRYFRDKTLNIKYSQRTQDNELADHAYVADDFWALRDALSRVRCRPVDIVKIYDYELWG